MSEADLHVREAVARVRGFYAILDRDDEALARALVAPGGATVLQVRLKPASTREILAAARMARRVATEAGAMLVVNDRVDIAMAVDADGVHLGQDDLTVADARAALAGRPMAIGVSTHDLQQVHDAIAAGADYLGFGPVFATGTKLNPDPIVGLDGLRAAVAIARAARVPVVAIGGITLADAAAVAATGADAAASIAAVNRAPDVAGTARTVAAHWRA